ncbi:hypothetical protein DFH06DRAFT_1150853 [Mycena polygramma]|nr:hypothetical protein DFH06DRAFT_1150853 [Mycena polygramma]
MASKVTGRKKRRPNPPKQQDNNPYVFSGSVADFLGGPSHSTNVSIETVVERPSADGRRVHTEVLPVAPPSPVKRMLAATSTHLDPVPMDLDPPLSNAWDGYDMDRYDMELGGFHDRPATPPLAPVHSKPFKPSDKSLFEWRPLRDEYLAELIRWAGCGEWAADLCLSCGVEKAEYRCRTCFGGILYCEECIVNKHADNPLHVVDQWNGELFLPSSLRALGLRISFGHDDCVRPHACNGFVVLDLGYIHIVNVDFCGCERRAKVGTERIQLLRRRWFPATHEYPRSAATLAMLDFFLMQTLQAKTTMYDFYTALEKSTDSTGVKPPNRYREFLRMVREYRHLLMLKRAGRGHCERGVAGTKPGELALRCPACPRPGVNLPDDWESAPPELRFLYTIFLALDACFRLKRRLVSSDLRDPGLGTGWAYFVEQDPYRKYLLTVTNQKEMSTCSGLAALDYANTKFSHGYSSTGVGMGVCARHEFVQPTGVGDLQKGERYANMDWIFAALRRWIDSRLFSVVSYDIVCQWWKSLVERLAVLPALVRLQLVLAITRFVIPKMHIHSHTLACQLLYSLNFLLGVGQTDGEGIERPWANIGGVATSTREMGPGSRRDTLDCHWAFWNWWKLVGIGALLRRRHDNAVHERDVQTEAFDAFTREQGDRKWEMEPAKNTNPYEMKCKGLTEAEVRLRLSEEEAAGVAKGVPSLHDVTPSAFIYAGLDLEDQQRRLRIQVELKKAGTTAQKIDILSLRTKLSRGIVRFRKLQSTYTPGALQALARREANSEELPETTPLMLPSAMTAAERETGCMAGVHLIEGLARDAQCSAALVRLRNQLHVKSRFLTYKELHSRNQGANTRSRTLVARNESKILLHSEKYQAAWNAMRLLSGGDATKVGWRQLRKEDIRLMEDQEELTQRDVQRKKRLEAKMARARRMQAEGDDGGLMIMDDEEDGEDGGGEGEDEGEEERVSNTTENRRLVSWIWTVAGMTGSDAELGHEAVSFEHEATFWEGRAKAVAVGVIPVELAEGQIAYVLGKAQMFRDLAQRVTVSMTEIHHGRGKKRTMPRTAGAPDVPNTGIATPAPPNAPAHVPDVSNTGIATPAPPNAPAHVPDVSNMRTTPPAPPNASANAQTPANTPASALDGDRPALGADAAPHTLKDVGTPHADATISHASLGSDAPNPYDIWNEEGPFDEGDGFDESDDERGDVHSDEELFLGGDEDD